jgi:hypothetical protein
MRSQHTTKMFQIFNFNSFHTNAIARKRKTTGWLKTLNGCCCVIQLFYKTKKRIIVIFIISLLLLLPQLSTQSEMEKRVSARR